MPDLTNTRRLLVFVALVAAASSSCSGRAELTPTPNKTAENFDRRECPHDPVFVLHERPSSGQFSSDRMSIPELHDCQRFIEEDNYTSLFAIFMGEQGPASDTQRPASDTIVALIVSEEGGSYLPLGITPPPGHPQGQRFFKCLLVYPVRPGTDELAARLVDVPSERDCSTSTPVNSNDFIDLDVRITPGLEHYDADHFPVVARWDFFAQRQYITLWCGHARWCDVVPRGMTLPAVPATGDWTRDIPGWHDRQVLASVAGNSLRPSGVTGTIYPALNLGRYTEDDFQGRWVPVASVELAASLPAYATEFNFAPPDGGRLSTISLCLGSRAACVPAGKSADVSACGADPTWWARLRRPTGEAATELYKCVTRYAVTNPVADPGTVRWRWRVLDEGGWMRCPQGCCELL
jgi:hypothetical protein